MEEVIRLFNERGVRYLVIGGQAVRLEGMPRFSMDWDFYIPANDLKNLALINDLLSEELDVPLIPMSASGEGFVQTYQTRWGILQFHLAGASLPPFDEAEGRAMLHNAEGVDVRCLCLDDLLASKKKAGRPQDLQDARFLEIKKRGMKAET